jgi:alpha-tubulin suppressor-like RCC1 family protein/phosphodiesterase/alkaline phosphatase D-like protein
MLPALRVFLCTASIFLACALSTAAAVVNATWNSATDVPVSASSYTATGSTVNFTLNYAPATGANLTVVNNTGLPFISGPFDNLAQGQTVTLSYNGVVYNFVANYYGGTGNDLVLVWASNRAFAWGYNPYGQLGDNTTTQRLLPTSVIATGVLAGKSMTALSANGSLSLALCSDGTVAAWGYNANGSLGNNTTANSSVPVLVNTASGVSALYGKTVVAVAAGGSHCLALCSDGTVVAWGYNNQGQLGINSTTQRLVPVAVNVANGVSALFGKTVVAIAAGDSHSLALCSDGTLAAWGDNTYGQLGDNTVTQRSVPVAVNAVSGVSAIYGKTVMTISAGFRHNLVLCSDGTPVAWGSNTNGQLGDTTTTLRSVPVAVNTASGTSVLFGKTLLAVSAGGLHSMALCSDGTVASWGNNTYGQIGDASFTQRTAPVAVNTTNGTSSLYGKTVVAVSAGDQQSMARCADGTVAAWGNNNNGELGDNTTTVHPAAVAVNRSTLTAAEPFAFVVSSPGYLHTLALVAEPVPVATTLAATAITSSSVTLNGTVNANNSSTAVSFDYGTTTAYGTNVAGTPTPLTGTSASAVSVSLTGLTPGTTYHFRANGSSSSGTANGGDLTFTTISNNANLSGLALSTGTLSPAFTGGMSSYTASVPNIVTSMTVTPTVADSTATVKVNGVAVSAGSASGAIALALGPNTITTVVTAQDGSTTQTYTVNVTRLATGLAATYISATDVPVTVNGLTATGNTVNLALGYSPATGTNLTLVNNTGLPLISGTFDNLAQGQLVTLSYNGVNYKFVANYYGGTGNDLVLVWANNRAFDWGDNSYGQIGDGTGTQRNVMVPVSATGVLAGRTILALSQSGDHCMALCSDGSVASWGSNYYGTLGNGTNNIINYPVAVSSVNGISALYGKTVVGISTGTYYSLALCSDGSVVSWGYNFNGQLGNNSTTNSNAPVLVNTASGTSALYGKSVVAVATGASHSVALCSDGTVATWGYNGLGQLGINNTTDSTVPVAVNTASGTSALYGKTVVAIAAGDFHTMALCSDGTVVAWGDGGYGALGNNNGSYSTVPVAVNTTSGVSALYGKTVAGITAGTHISMALCTDGTLTAWGYNNTGQLGNNSTTNSLVPALVNVANGTSALFGKTVVGIAMSGSSATALCSDGSVATWGYNWYGQLGNNTTNNSLVPQLALTTPLSAGERVTAPAAASNRAQSLVLVAEPLPVAATLAASALGSTTAVLNGTATAGSSTAVAVSFDYGTTTAYGSSSSATPSSVTGFNPTAVSTTLSGLSPLTTYHFRVNAAGYVGADQTFTTLNNDATLAALSTSAGALSPAFASGTTSYSAPAVSATTTSITVTPGVADSNATLTVNGVSAASGSSAPVNLGYGLNAINVQVTAQDGITQKSYTITVTRRPPTTIAATYGSATDVPLTTNGLTATGSTVNLSLNYAPATGTNLMIVNNTGLPFISGTFGNLTQGQAVTLTYNGVTFNFVANYYGGTGNDLVLVWARNRVLGWGQNNSGQIGDTSFSNRGAPVAVTATGVLAGKTIVALSTGASHSLALCSDGTLAAWGDNTTGCVGDNTTTLRNAPVLVNTASGVSALYGKTVVAIAAGANSSMALCSDGTVAAWGYNFHGQLGDATTTNRTAPVAVNTASGVSALYGKTVTAIAAGGYHSLALCSDGTVVTWGNNGDGQLGNSSTTNSTLPVLVNVVGASALNGKTVLGLAGGLYHSLVLCSDGSIVAWGRNDFDQLGVNGFTSYSTPVATSTASGTSALYGKIAAAISAGDSHSLALCTDGTLLAWGYNPYGQLGNNSTSEGFYPLAVNTASGVSALYGKTVVGISGAAGYTTALCADGTIAAWGHNFSNQLGNNSTIDSRVPVLTIGSALSAGERFVSLAPGCYTSHELALVAAPPAAPAATTLAATAVTGTGVTLHGTVNANNSTTAVSFDYGTTTSYGTNVAGTPASLSSGTATAVNATVSGLSPLTTYHFRVNGVSGAGSAAGSDLTFTTLNNNATLSALALSSGTLSPAFAASTTAYTATVPYATSALTLTPAVADSNASVKVNGVTVASGSASASIPLSLGDNTLTAVVTAQDGSSTLTYLITVTRQPLALAATYSSSTDVPLTTNGLTATGNTVSFSLNYAPATGTNLTVVNNTGLPFINGTFDNLAQGQAVTLSYGGKNYYYVAHYFGGTGNDLVLMWASNRLFAWGSNGAGQVGDSSTTQRTKPVPVWSTGILADKTVVAVAVGNLHSLALCSDGTVVAWGGNSNGQLGNNSTTPSTTPVLVNTTAGLSALAGKTVVAVAAGGASSMALCSDGTVVTWGYNLYGQLGINSNAQSTVPVAVNTDSGTSALYGKSVVSISMGMGHGTALCSDGTVATWGWNLYGQLGINNTTSTLVPVLVNTSSGVSALYGKTVSSVAAGWNFTLALCSDGSLAAWGDNASGQVGDNTSVSRNAPVAVNAVNGTSALYGRTPVAIAAGFGHGLALCTDGRVLAWGDNTLGQLGDNSATLRRVPVLVSASSGVSDLFGKTVTSLGCGGAHSAARCTDGTLVTWGYNATGQLGVNSTTNSSVAKVVDTSLLNAGEGFAAVSTGPYAYQTLALVASPSQPIGTTLAASSVTYTSATMNGAVDANQAATTVSFDYGLTTAYGSNVTATPSSLSGSTITAVSAALSGLPMGTTYHYRVRATSAAGTTTGADLTFTTNSNVATLSSLASSAGTLTPAFASGTTSYTATVPSTTGSLTLTPTTSDSTATVKINGTAIASGSATASLLLVTGDNVFNVVVTSQDGSTTKTYTLTVTRPSMALAASYSSATDVALTTNGLSAAGNTVNFSLSYAPATGTNLTVVNNTALSFIGGTFDNLAQGQTVVISYGGRNYTYVANYYGGTGNDLVLVWASNRLFAWGKNANGQIGDTTTTQRNIPVPVVATGVLAGKTVIAVASGNTHSLALCSDGTVAAWGDNTNGQLGNNSTTASTTPVAVSTLAGTSALSGKTVVAIATGGDSSMALCSDGSMATWGNNSVGQLGNNSTTSSSVPVLVSTASGVSALYGKSVVAISAGNGYSVVLCSDGTLATWGGGIYGTLGNNSTANSSVPVLVNTNFGTSALYGKTVVSVAAGWNHTLALCSDGTLVGWGANTFGEVGDNTNTQRNVPVPVSTASGISALYGRTPVSIAVGFGLSLALCSDGAVIAWGTDTNGQLGNNSTTSSSVPVLVNRASGVSDLYGKTVAALGSGGAHGAALCTDGSLTTWGSNLYGQLGVNSTTQSSVAKTVNTSQLNAGEVFASVSAGSYAYHALALVAAPALPPVSTTLAATAVTGTSVTLNGTVNANNRTTAVSFDYALTNSYGTNVAATPASLSGSSATAVSAAVTGLTPGTTYHFRVNASNDVGTSTGADLTFTTPNNNAGLTALALNNGTLTPAFATGTASYTASVPYAVSSITLRPTLADTNASVKVNGVTVTSGSASAAIPLNIGDNTLTTVVTAQDGTTTQTYTVVVTRAASSTNAVLASLTSNIGAFTPTFDSGTASYTATVPFATNTLTLTPSAADSTATLKVNGVSIASGNASAPLTLNLGDTAFNVVVTAQDGTTTQTYTLTVTRQTTALAASYNAATDVPLTMNGVTATGSTVNLSLNFAPATGANLMVVNNTGPGFITGTFSNLAQGQAVAFNYNGIAYNYVANYYGGTGNDLVLVWAYNRVLAWGDNAGGEIGDNSTTNRLLPTAVTASGVLAGKTIIALASGGYHSLALCSDGTLAAWGDNSYGNLGDNTTTQRKTPVLVNTASGVSALYGKTVVAIAAGYYTSFALCSDGTLAAWGLNTYGGLGDSTTTNSSVPVAVNTASGTSALYGKTVVAVSAGSAHSLALCSDGSVAAWGYNFDGELGDNTTTQRTAPVAVNTASGVSALYGRSVVSISTGQYHNVALCADGTLAAWGYNGYGQLGDNSTTQRNAPVLVNTVSGLSALYGKTVQGISLGVLQSAAMGADGTLATWGYNGYGALGNNTTTASSLPVTVNTTALSSGEQFVRVTGGSYAYHMLGLVASPSPAPTVATLAATSIITTGATLNGTANANSSSTTVSFEYGLTTAYGSTVAATPGTLTDGSTAAESATLIYLAPGTAYHYRIKAVSGAGTSFGSDATFTTLSNDAALSGLTPGTGTLSPTFSSGTTSYTLAVPYTTTSITLRPFVRNVNASVTINGVAVASGSNSAPLPLSVGPNTLTVLVTAQDGTTLTYTVTAGRASPSTNATLVSLNVSAGSLSPAFSGSTLSYTDIVSYSTTSIMLTASLADGTATMKVNGTTLPNNSVTAPIPLNVGGNVISTVVTAQDGTTQQTYTLTVTRPAFPATWNTAGDIALTTSSFTASGNALGALTLNFAPTTGASLLLINNTGLGFISGTFSNLAQGQAVALSYNGATYNYVANYYGGTGNDLVLVWAGNRALATGYNSDGELGDATTTQRSTAVPVIATGVLAGKTILSVAAGARHSLALCSDGTLAAWGSNASGQLGDNTTTDRSTPVAVNTSLGVSALYGKTVIAIAAGQSHSLALCSDGALVAWGENLYNQLGDTTTTQRNAAVAVNTSSGTSSLYTKTVVGIAAGARHNLALCSDGTVSTWGSNTAGQLGDNTYSPRSAPVAVNTTSGISALNGRLVQAVAAGGLHSVALCTDATLVAWGNDVNGELGDDNAAQFYSNSPAAVVVKNTAGSALAGKTVVAIATGYAHNLALCTDGSLVAWGQNTYGQLGNNGTDSAYVPVPATTAGSALAGKTIAAISAGARHSLAQCSDGTLTAWGLASSGQLGSGSTTSSGLAVAVSTTPLGAGEGYISAGSGPYALHTLALAATIPLPPPTALTLIATGVGSTSAALNATVNASGTSTTVSFDYGTTTAYGQNVSATPATVTGTAATAASGNLSALQAATTYHFRVRAVSAAGTAIGADQTFTTLNYDANLSGLAVSSGTLSPSFTTSGNNYSVAVPTSTTSITVTPTASDSSGATLKINGTPSPSGSASSPIPLAYGDNVISIVITAQDGVTNWTYTVTVTRAFPPTWPVTFASASDLPLSANGFAAAGAVDLSLGFAPTPGTTLTLINNTSLGFISGSFSNLAHGQLVNLTYNGTTYTFLASYYGGTGNDLVLIWASSRLMSWGDNIVGGVGDGSLINRKSPVPVTTTGTPLASGLTPLGLAVGAGYSLALCADGSLLAWGSNSEGELGNNTLTDTTTPGAVITAGTVLEGKTVVAVSAGAIHNLVLCSDGTLAGWGNNGDGQLANPIESHSALPVPVVTLGTPLFNRSVAVLGTGSFHNVVLCTDGTLVSWGRNDLGQLGNSTTTRSRVPVAVATAGTALAGKSVMTVAAGSDHNIALCYDGTVITWGYNLYGQLGNNTTINSTVPIAVPTAGTALEGKTVVAVDAGGNYSLALCSDGTLVAWGDNSFGQLGIGTSATNSKIPVAVNTGTTLAGKTVSELHAGNVFSMVRCTDGTTAAWGYNVEGELGNNSTSNSNVPVLVGSGRPFMRVVAGGNAYDSLALVATASANDPLPSSDASLSALTLSAGSLNMPFVSSSYYYFTVVDSSVTSLTLTPTANESHATITVNGVAVTSGAATISIPLVAGLGGNSISVVVTAQDGFTQAQYSVFVACLGKVEQWRFQAFGTPLPLGITADNADFDGDGICNLLEYALNLSPTAASKLPVTSKITNGNYEYTYTRSTAAVNAGTTFSVQWSPSLSAPSWNGAGVTESVLSDDGTTQQVKALIPVNANTSMFVHLSVTAPP